ncbi:uncharacterized protein EV154DRAFT_572412 [Mucor mucedo]|uniref:uncharacterized protein n=1 Tax=Mucor mucedo TaxID=29922 RepID=UPI00221F25DA|nr:uncharacterized protein EV154DRAFT_572412 [Mucor mucedo]KAI7864633.1 hypothetical protein EV154DRAFT_572412 [Mucor mucedo]
MEDIASFLVSSSLDDDTYPAVSFPSGDNAIKVIPSLMEDIASFLVSSSVEDDTDPAVSSPLGDNADPSVVGGSSVGIGSLEVPLVSPGSVTSVEWPGVGSVSPSPVFSCSPSASPVVGPASSSSVLAIGSALDELESLPPSSSFTSVNLASPPGFPRPSLWLSSAGEPSEELRSPSLSPILRQGNLASPVFRPLRSFREIVDAAPPLAGLSLLPKTPVWSPVASSSALEDPKVGEKRRSCFPSPRFSPRRRVMSVPAEDTFSLPPPALSSGVGDVVASSPSPVSSVSSAASAVTFVATPSSLFSAAAVAAPAVIVASPPSPVLSVAATVSVASVASSPSPRPFSSSLRVDEPATSHPMVRRTRFSYVGSPWENLDPEKFRDPFSRTEQQEQRKCFFTRPPGPSRL